METYESTPNKQQQAYEQIKSNILNGTYGAGYRIVVDRIARELGVSAIPVREAVRRLEAEGFVEYERFSGVRVIRIDEVTYAQSLQVLAVLEGYATRLASRHLTAENLQDLHDITKKMAVSRADFDLATYGHLNQQFHQMICEKCANNYLFLEWKTVQERLNALRTSVFMLIPHRATDSIEEHLHLLSLIEKKADEQEIELYARTHKLATLQAFEKWKQRGGAT
ncbi:GntR family transcriptional regulator [Sulfoacidibacillus thermotolerans]|uniref:HTH gntR-type domain-containing protein n=1 Tax=Sulfoacidibacillus thermotolerans TaxID=1765684 RepID=A0A2U3D897_SULT2|nr:GntR family transcriptional regulator [Sulfoacidibacillus thermotolerans]PWI57514.1 hypothetical protein BM613_08405 [Sulfoacidibacillus thermotolerans]